MLVGETKMKCRLNGSAPTECPGRILAALGNDQIAIETLIERLNYQWSRRTVYWYLAKLAEQKKINRILTINGFRKIEYRVRR